MHYAEREQEICADNGKEFRRTALRLKSREKKKKKTDDRFKFLGYLFGASCIGHVQETTPNFRLKYIQLRKFLVENR